MLNWTWAIMNVNVKMLTISDGLRFTAGTLYVEEDVCDNEH